MTILATLRVRSAEWANRAHPADVVRAVLIVLALALVLVKLSFFS